MIRFVKQEELKYFAILFLYRQLEHNKSYFFLFVFEWVYDSFIVIVYDSARMDHNYITPDFCICG